MVLERGGGCTSRGSRRVEQGETLWVGHSSILRNPGPGGARPPESRDGQRAKRLGSRLDSPYLAEHKLCVSVEFTTMEGIKALGCAFLAMLISVGSTESGGR